MSIHPGLLTDLDRVERTSIALMVISFNPGRSNVPRVPFHAIELLRVFLYTFRSSQVGMLPVEKRERRWKKENNARLTSVEDTESSLGERDLGESGVVVNDRVSSSGPSGELRDVSVGIVGVEVLEIDSSVTGRGRCGEERRKGKGNETDLSSSTEKHIRSVPLGPGVVSSNTVEVHLSPAQSQNRGASKSREKLTSMMAAACPRSEV